jgi:hypothetical protein
LQAQQLAAQPFFSAHDTSNLPWVVVGAYALTAALAIVAAFGAETRPERRFWAIVTSTSIFLGFNKQLDLQTYLTDAIRQMAIRGGWYEHRRPVQAAFIAFDALIAVGVGVYFMRLAVAAGARVRIATVGLVLLGAYILLRAASLHHVDSLLGRLVNGVKAHNYVELSCILVVIVGAGLPARRQRPATTTE